MPPKRKQAQDELLEIVPVGHKGRRHHDDSDPREPLKVGTSGVATPMDGSARPTAPAGKSEERAAEDLSTRYARALVAYSGDIPKALARTFGITEDEAEMDMVALHDKARGMSRVNTNISDMMERHDLTLEVRLARLREMLFSNNPAVVLKAIDVIQDIDVTSKSKRIGTSWESFVAKVRSGAGPKAQAAARTKALAGKTKAPTPT